MTLLDVFDGVGSESPINQNSPNWRKGFIKRHLGVTQNSEKSIYPLIIITEKLDPINNMYKSHTQVKFSRYATVPQQYILIETS